MNKLGLTILTFGAYLLAGSANANVVALDDYNGPDNQITCSPSCEGFIGPNPGTISLSLTSADDYDKAGNPTKELARLNELLAQFNPARSSVSFVDKTDIASNTWSTDRQYFSIKKSQNLWFFENTSGGLVTITAHGNPWSHTTEYGAVVPIPAAAWLFGSALLGLASFGRRRN